MADASAPLRVNRAPVLTLWAAVVAERLGHPPDTALSLARAVAGTAARAKARRLGISEERDRAKDAAPAKPADTTRLLGKSVRLTAWCTDQGCGRTDPEPCRGQARRA